MRTIYCCYFDKCITFVPQNFNLFSYLFIYILCVCDTERRFHDQHLLWGLTNFYNEMLKHLAYLVESLKHLYSVTCCRHSIIVVMVVSMVFRCSVSMSRVHWHMAVLFIHHVVLVTPWRLSSSISSTSLVSFQPVSVKTIFTSLKSATICLSML